VLHFLQDVMHAQIPIEPGRASIAVFGFPGLGDLVRCHSLIQLIAAQYPKFAIDVIARRPTVDIVRFMPEVRDAIGTDFRHNRLSTVERLRLAQTLRAKNYAAAYIIQSSFKAAVVPFLAQIPERIGWACEGRRPLLTKAHSGMHRVPRMVDRICRLGIPAGATPPSRWPELRPAARRRCIRQAERRRFRSHRSFDQRADQRCR
jgi:lipopolysaccharide heptosyltransferase II